MSKPGFSWMSPKVEVRDTGRTGKGVFAKADINKGEKLVIFGGYAMPLEEFFQLPPDAMHFSSQIDEEFVFGIRSVAEEEDACFVNHPKNGSWTGLSSCRQPFVIG